MKKNFAWSILCALLLCSACSSYSEKDQVFENITMEDYEKAQALQPYYNPDEIFINDLVLYAKGTGYLEIHVSWIGKDVQQFVLDLQPFTPALIDRIKTEKVADLDLYSGQTIIRENASGIRKIIEYIDKHYRLPISIDGQTSILIPYNFYGTKYPYPFLLANFQPLPFVKYNKQQKTDNFEKSMEAIKQQVKKDIQ